MKTTITFEIDSGSLKSITDEYLSQLWHIAQANPASTDNREAGMLAEHIGREIIRRFVAGTPPELWAHQGRHYPQGILTKNGKFLPPDFVELVPNQSSEAGG